MAKELQISLVEKTAEHVHIFRIEGSLGIEGAAGIQGLLEACLKEKVYRLVLDVDGVNFISSAGMGAFLAAVGELRKNDGDMILVRLQDKIKAVFRNLDVLDYFVLGDDVAQAVESFRTGKLPRPPSLEELTAAATAERAGAEDAGQTRTIFSLLAAYADILDAEADLSPKLAQLVDITANYLALEECALVPLSDELGLATTTAHGFAVAPPAGVKSVLAAALAGKEVVAVEQFPGMNKDVASWFARCRVHFLFPLEVSHKVVAVLLAGDKKDGRPMAPDERRILRYLRVSLNLAYAAHLTTRRLRPAPAVEKQMERKLMEMETLFTIAQGMVEAQNVDKMLPTLLMMVTGQFGTDRAVVLLETPDGDYGVRAARGVDDVKQRALKLPPRGLVERLDEATRPQPATVLSLVLDDAERRQLTPFLKQGLTVLAPLRFKGRTFGVVALGEKISGRDFDVEELKLFGALVNLGAVSMETARLLSRIKETYAGLVRALITAIEAKDKYTRGHTERVARYAAALAAELGLNEEMKQNLLFSAVLHDVGYIGVPENVLQMPNGITAEQLAELRRHPDIGVHILKDLPLFHQALPVIRHHHEHYDGSGYPGGLAGENIPYLARIVAVADVFDAMTSERRYRKAKTVDEAVTEIRENRGSQFDPHVADTFVALITSGRLGVITSKD